AVPNRLKLFFTERAGFNEPGIFLPPFRLGCADDGGVNARDAQSEAQCDGNGCFQIVVAQKIVIQFSQAFPIFVVVRLRRLVSGLPRDVGDGALGDYAHLFLPGRWRSQVDRFLIRDVDGGLQSVECASLDGVVSSTTVAAVTVVASSSSIA